MIFLNSNNRESHQNEESNRKTSFGRTSQPQLGKKSNNLRQQKLVKKSCKETTVKVLAFIGVFGLLAGVGLLIFGIIQIVNKNDSSNSVAIATIASASALILISIISLIAVSWILCFGKK